MKNSFDGSSEPLLTAAGIKLPTFLYHGTLSSNVDSIISHGLLPGAENGKNNYSELARPQSSYVYLSHGWAIQYALASALTNNEGVALVRVSVSHLERERMRPDEDYYIEWVMPGERQDEVPDIDIVVPEVLERMEREPERLADSLTKMSNLAYRGD